MDRLETKTMIALVVSNLGIMGKTPPGRLDALTDTFDTSPQVWKDVVLNVRSSFPQKGSWIWRVCKDYALTLKEILPKNKRRPRTNKPKIDQERKRKPVFELIDTGVRFKKSFIKELIDAGKQYASDNKNDQENNEDISGVSWDLAESVLIANNVDKSTPRFNLIKDAAACFVHEGLIMET